MCHPCMLRADVAWEAGDEEAYEDMFSLFSVQTDLCGGPTCDRLHSCDCSAGTCDTLFTLCRGCYKENHFCELCGHCYCTVCQAWGLNCATPGCRLARKHGPYYEESKCRALHGRAGPCLGCGQIFCFDHTSQLDPKFLSPEDRAHGKPRIGSYCAFCFAAIDRSGRVRARNKRKAPLWSFGYCPMQRIGPPVMMIEAFPYTHHVLTMACTEKARLYFHSSCVTMFRMREAEPSEALSEINAPFVLFQGMFCACVAFWRAQKRLP